MPDNRSRPVRQISVTLNKIGRGSPTVPDNPTKPSLQLLTKLGSLIVHYQEFNSPKSHQYDKLAIEQLEADPQVSEWIDAMKPFLPVKR